MMPYLIATLLSFLGQALLGLGVGFVSQKVVIPEIMDQIQARLSLVPPWVIEIFGFYKFDVFISLALSGAAAGSAGKLFARKK